MMAVGAWLCLAGPAQAASRVALIIANYNYVNGGNLTNPPADARIMRDALRRAGFDQVTVAENLGRTEMSVALQTFGEAADAADVALLYYAGHGIEVESVNYLIPVDAKFVYDRDVDIWAIKLDTALKMTDRAKRLRLIILDACRDNPFLSTLQRTRASTSTSGKGLAAIETSTPNSLVVFSAKAGTTATDGVGNSPFAASLASRIVVPGVEISDLFRQVHDDVVGKTERNGLHQEVVSYGSLTSQHFYFIPAPVLPPAPVVAAVDMEAEAWALCRASVTRSPCDAYLANYKTGRFATLAGTRIADLTPRPVPVAVVAAAPIAPPPAQVAVASIATPTVAPPPAPPAAVVATAAAATTPAPVQVAPVRTAPAPAQQVALADTRTTTVTPVVPEGRPALVPAIVPKPRPTPAKPAAAEPQLAMLRPVTAVETRTAVVSPAPMRVADLGMTVHWDAAARAIFVDSIEREAKVTGRLFAGDLITRVAAADPDAAQPAVQLAAEFKTEGRLKLLVKRGEAVSSIIIRGDQ